ncbi:MAG: hypothetical protein AAB225_25605 [Acidobacteriota bacterium]
MISDRKLEANRRNARRSKGPNTPQGKAAVRFNALKHGLRAEHLVLEDEEQPAFDELLSTCLAEHQPQGPTETDLVHQLVTASWRLRRLRTMETGLFDIRLADHDEALKREYVGIGIQGRLAYVFACRTGEFNILARYEARVERSFYRALHELQRLKAGRAGQPIPPPQVIEVNAPEDPEPPPQPSGNFAEQSHRAATHLPAHHSPLPTTQPPPAYTMHHANTALAADALLCVAARGRGPRSAAQPQGAPRQTRARDGGPVA